MSKYVDISNIKHEVSKYISVSKYRICSMSFD